MKVLRITPERCTGCMRCELACSYVQTGAFQPARSVIRVSPFEGHTSYAPFTCTQCAEGWCMTACPVEAITISPVGAKALQNDQCVGCKLCTIACPYGTMFYNSETRKAFKCNLCGGTPACAAACPTTAIEYVEAETADWLGGFAVTTTARDGKRCWIRSPEARGRCTRGRPSIQRSSGCRPASTPSIRTRWRKTSADTLGDVTSRIPWAPASSRRAACSQHCAVH